MPRSLSKTVLSLCMPEELIFYAHCVYNGVYLYSSGISWLMKWYIDSPFEQSEMKLNVILRVRYWQLQL